MATADVYRRGCEAWPDLGLTFERFEALTADSPTRDGPPASVDAGELVLAAACADRDAAALQIFDNEYIEPCRALVGRELVGRAVETDDVLQQVRCDLLLPKSSDVAEIALLRYAGRGQLRGLVRTIVRRACIKARRGRDVPKSADALDVLGSAVEDALGSPTTSSDRERAATKQAVADAWDAIPSEQRLLLQLHHLKGLPVRRLAAIYGIHAATAARRVAAARLAFAGEVRVALERHDPERAAAIRLEFESRLSLSFLRLGMDEGSAAPSSMTR